MLLAVVFVLACGGVDDFPVTPEPPAQPEPPKTATKPQDAWGEIASMRQNVTFRLPDAAGWKIDDAPKLFFVATHAATGSVVRLRRWREGTRETRATCEALARVRADLPAREGADIVETFKLPDPPDHDTTVEVGVRSTKPRLGGGEPELEGFVVAFGGYTKSCFAFSYVTRARGDGAEREVGDRLAKIAHTTLPTMRFETDLEPSINRTPRPR